MTKSLMKQTTGPTVDGRFVAAFVDGVGRSCGYFRERAQRLLASHGIEEPQGGESYPLQTYLGAVFELQQTTGPNILNRIGLAASATLQFSPGVRSIEDAFRDLDRAFSNAHDDAPVEFDFRPHDDGGVLVVETPYPVAFERGLIEGVGKEFGTNTGFISIEENNQSWVRGEEARAFDLTWWETRDDLLQIGAPEQRPAAATTHSDYCKSIPDRPHGVVHR